MLNPGHDYHDPYVGDRRSKQYCAVLFLPFELNEIVATLRAKYDPDHNLVDAHVTVVFPFETEQPLEEIVGTIKSVTDKIKPIEVCLDDLCDFYPGSPIIYWNVAASNELKKLYYDLNVALSDSLPFAEWIPHVTIGREISNHRVMLVKENICNYLSDEKFLAESLDLITPLANNRWVSVRSFGLLGII